MTMTMQNHDFHRVNHLMFLNSVSGNPLPNQAPQQDLLTVSNMTFLPSANDQLKQRFNYIVLVSRLLVQYFDAFQPLKHACVQHIPHKYSKEMSEKSGKVNKSFEFLICSYLTCLWWTWDSSLSLDRAIRSLHKQPWYFTLEYD